MSRATRRGSGRAHAIGLLLALGLLLVACLSPASALAVEGHVFKETFGSAAQPTFAEAAGLTVDSSTGDLLVADESADTISRYHSDGTPASFAALGTNVIDGKAGPDETPQKDLHISGWLTTQIAIDNSGGPTDGDIYITDFDKSRVVNIFAPDGHYLGQLSEAKLGPKAEGAFAPFGGPIEGGHTGPAGVAVDSAGVVYVSDYKGQVIGEVHKFVPSGTQVVNADNVANFLVAEPLKVAAGAGPVAGFIFVTEFEAKAGHGHLVKLDAETGEEKYAFTDEKGTAPGYSTVAVDPASGHVYASSGFSSIDDYDASGVAKPTRLDRFGTSSAFAFAVSGASGDIFIPQNESTIEVWETVRLPEATTEPASSIGAGAVTLNGTLNPAGGASANCEFQYISQARAEANLEHNPVLGEFAGATTGVPCAPPGPFTGSTTESVSADVDGLEPGTTYRFRVVGTNAHGSTEATPRSFLTLGPTIGKAEITNITATSATVTGSINPRGEPTSFAVQYVTQASFEESGYAKALSVPAPALDIGSETSFIEVTEKLSGLSPATTYHFRLVATNPSATSTGTDRRFTTFAVIPLGLPDGRAYEMVTPPVKLGEVFPPDRGGNLGGTCSECLPGLNFEPMAMQSAPDGNSIAYSGQPFAAGTATGPNEYLSRRGSDGWGTQSLSSPSFGSPRATRNGFQAFSDDLSRAVIAQVHPALSPEAPLGEEGESFPNLYFLEGGEALRPLVTEAPPHRSTGSFELAYGGANRGTSSAAAFSHVIFAADDALTEEIPGVAPAAPEVPASHCRLVAENCDLYEWADGRLALVNVLPGNNAVSAGGTIGSGHWLTSPDYQIADVDHAISDDGSHIIWSDPTGHAYVRINGEETQRIEDPGKFLIASSDGSKVLLSDGCLYSLEEEECIEDLSEGEGGFLGISGASEDLSRIFFVDTAMLSGENPEHNSPLLGKPNLYAWSGGTTVFIGTLRDGDNKHGLGSPLGAWKAYSTGRTAQASPDGRYLAFMSSEPLTGFDNRVAGGGICSKGTLTDPDCSEVFEYDSVAEHLTCASCNPTGQLPLGSSNLTVVSPKTLSPAFPQPGNLAAEGHGRLFFESQDVLSPHDENGHIQDVYEWEPNEVGDCKRASGCTSLISSGQSPNDSMFLDATPSGNDAFFITREKLLAPDTDELLDVYDARVGGGIPENNAPPCLGEACKGQGTSAPELQSAGSSTFSGPGNEKQAPKKHKKKRHKHKAKKKAHKRAAKHNRGGSK